MGELVDLEEYRNLKNAEIEAQELAEIEALQSEVAEMMSKLSLDPTGYYSIYPNEYKEFTTLWPPAGSYGHYMQDETFYEDHYVDYEDTKSYYLDLDLSSPKTLKKEKTSEIESED
jgi:hypothetical protein